MTRTGTVQAGNLLPGDLWAGNGSTIEITAVEDIGFPFPAFPETPGVRVSGQIVRGLGRSKKVRSWTLDSRQWCDLA